MSPSEIAKAVLSIAGAAPLHDPFIDDVDVQNVADCARDDPVGYSYIRRLEEAVAERCQRKYAIGVSSGTAALHLALLAAGVKPNDLVSVPTMTFAGVAAAVTYCQATPYLFDKLAAGARVMVVNDLLGYPDRDVSFGHHRIIEDAAAALGSIESISKAPCGARGFISTISFNNNKIVTTNGGGMVLTNDEDAAVLVRHLATTAKVPSRFFYDHNMVGFNYRMSNLGAALAIGQMARLDDILAMKQELADKYRAIFGSMMFVPAGNKGDRPNHWLNAIVVEAGERDATLRALGHVGIGVRALYTPLHRQEPYKNCPRAETLEAADHLYETVVCLPSGRTACGL